MTPFVGRKFRKLSVDIRGNVSMTFGLMSIVLFLMMGGAIDFGRWHQARQQTIAAMDAAVLAAGQRLQVNNSDIQGAIAIANKFYAENTKSRLPIKSDTVTFEAVDDNMAIQASGTATIETTLLKLAGIDDMPLIDLSGSEANKAVVTTGANAGVNLEISMMLDITGSMSGQKLTDLKEASKDLIDIVVWDNQSNYTSKVALVPFSQSVNVGSLYFNAITNASTSSTLTQADPNAIIGPPQPSLSTRMLAYLPSLTSAAHARNGFGNGNGGNGNGNGGNGNGNGGDDDDHNSGGGSSHNYDPCVVDRTGSNVFTDTAPGPGNYFGVYDVEKQSNWSTKDMGCRPGSITIMPLSNDKTALKAKINSFVADGYTAGHIGTAFAWYMLSPEWADIWPSASEPASYTDADTKKIAILMTDGVYNVKYNGSSHGSPSDQAVSLCTGMKAKGIEVYTVGFDLGGSTTAINTLNSCATSAGHAYIADNGEGLKEAFRDIAIKVSKLRLSQ